MEQVILAERGETSYRLIVPENCGKKTKYAAELFQKYFRECTGAELPFGRDGGAEKAVSVGETKRLAEFLGGEPREKMLDALNIRIAPDAVYLYGDDEDGTVNAVVEFLEKYLSVRFFAPDETLCPKTERVVLPVGSYRSVPDFETRMLGYYGTMSNEDFALKKRVLYDHSNWGLWAHSHFVILPPEKYDAEHPDWYSADKTQLCLTNEEMRKQFVENLWQIICEKPDAEYFMLGQEDDDTFCDCERCRASHEKYGGRSGTMMVFVNHVAEEIEKRIRASSRPDRKVLLVTFAYCKTEQAPVLYDEKSDEFRLVHKEVRARSNVGVMFAPIFTCFTHDMMNKTCNAKVRANLLGWSAVSEKLLVWCYSSNYAGYLVPLNNFNTIVSTYRTFRKYGVVYIFNQGIFNSPDTFHYLKIYLHSALMWNVDADMGALEKEFMRNYYKAAAPHMEEYYQLIRENYDRLDTSEHPFHTYCLWNKGAAVFTEEVFPREFLDKCEKCIDDGLRSVLSDNSSDPIMEILRLRIIRESLFVRYMRLELYHDDYDRAELFRMISEFECLAKITGVTRVKTGGGVRVGGPEMRVKIAEWKKKYLGEAND